MKILIDKHKIKKLKKINALLADIKRNGVMQGIGKPEPLKHRHGYSRRIDDYNRLVYDIDELQNIKVISCKGHYEVWKTIFIVSTQLSVS